MIMVLLRGYLQVDLIEAKNLPDFDRAFFNINPRNKSDATAQVKLGTSIICKTARIDDDLSPKWNESFWMPICHIVDKVQVQVHDKDDAAKQLMGEFNFRAEDLVDGRIFEGWYPLSGCEGSINLKLYFVSKDSIEATFEVPKCYFDQREGCKLTLYQDAHCPYLPFHDSVSAISGKPYIPPCAWIDLHNALNRAQKLIYISGWSVFTETILVRDENGEDKAKKETVGELLKRKAGEGVRVLVMIWNDNTSNCILGGFMGTHDEDTRKYFRGSAVEVAAVPRTKSLKGLRSLIRTQVIQTIYTHHQKTVVVDVPIAEGEKLPRLQAFVGGLDITNGRYDTPEHELFRTLHTLHKGDFYNGIISADSAAGPREPWHDIHCKLDGPIVMDVLANFTERWLHQVPRRIACLQPNIEEEFAFDAPAVCDNNASWNAQLFRSITSDAAVFEYEKVHNIPMRKGRYVDDSIHRAYIHHIRRAKSFLFMENQYFLGSAFNWNDEKCIKAHHLVPQEITQHIVEKINAGLYFAAYVIVPMFPEGDPASCAMQEILHWQHRTMEMMYRDIAQAIEANGLDTHPRDYLSFFCLGKGESPNEIPENLCQPTSWAPAYTWWKQAKFMIYVHSKMMIVDDDYIIVGSANINQRSMGGTRDTEIAIGSYQPQHTRADGGKANGEIHRFRLSLWAEHLNGVEEVHAEPGSIECMRAVNVAADSNLESFLSETPSKIDARLLSYPVDIHQDGSVAALKGHENFPNTNAPVLGNVLVPKVRITT